MGDLIDIIEEYILISDIKGSILKCNSELLYRLEYNEEEVKKLNIKNLINYNSINIEGYINSNKNKCNYEESYDINNLKIYPKNSNPFTVSGKFILKKYKEKEYIIIIFKMYNQ